MISGALFVFNERVVVNANRQVTAWSFDAAKPMDVIPVVDAFGGVRGGEGGEQQTNERE